MANAGSSGETWSVARLLNWTREYFEQKGVESPRLCAEILLAHILKCRRLELYTRYESEPSAAQREQFREAVKEAASGKPIAYLTGQRDFFSLNFVVTPDVLIPRPETEVLVERVVSMLRDADRSGLRILDVGTGSGCIIVALAKNLAEPRLYAGDISEAALAVARENARRLGVEQRIEFRSGDLLAPWAGEPPFDVIVSNPPYIAERDAATLPANVRDFEPRGALFAGEDGLAIIRRLVADALPMTRPGGHLLIEVAYDQAQAVCALFRDAGWGDVVTYRDDLRHERVVHGKRPA
ncbi:MAG: peptide chain release factor N(5)-glutamine methyltransferase [Planctomycetes bacterium]|nr:peptide chain release factor N(5)-glutamine methyltransferase [Planctomycetota bacterium]